MVVNMDKGVLSFKSDTEDFGTAVKGLSCLGNCIHVAAELSKVGDKITMKYLGMCYLKSPHHIFCFNIEIHLQITLITYFNI